MTEQNTVRLRTPEDVIAFVPNLLGFRPAESLVMLTFGAAQPFHARIDMPTTEVDRRGVVDALLGPCVRHGVAHVLLVWFTNDGHATEQAHDALARAFDDAGIGVALGLQVTDTHFRPIGQEWQPYDTAGTEIAAQMVYAGRAPVASRDELVRRLRPHDPIDPDMVRAYAECTAARAVIEEIDHEAVTTSVLVGSLGAQLPDDMLAALVGDLTNAELRDAVIDLITRENAEHMVPFFTEVVRRTPDPYMAAPATLLALASWLDGNGALAWCALDRVEEAGHRHYGLAALLARLLTEAIAPSRWDEIREALA